jgi:hypothetical protein
MVNQTPSMRPADESSLAGVMKTAIRKELQNLNVMLPVEVVGYDRATNRATIKHLVQMEGANGEKVSRANVASIRVLQPGNGAFSISLPIKPGDKGWLMAADRDISVFQQGLSEGAPNTARMHSFQDGLFMPDAMANGDAPAGQGDRVVIGSNDGGSFLAFDGDGFYFNVGGTEFTLTAAGFAQTGGTVSHNGKDIGDTHIHDGVTPGGGNTGEPV